MKIHDANGHYSLKVTPHILEKYSSAVGFDLKSPDTRKLELLVYLAISDYLQGIIGVDDLTYIVTQLYFEVYKPSWFDNSTSTSQIGSLLSHASEGSYIFWRGNEEEKLEFNQKLTELLVKIEPD